MFQLFINALNKSIFEGKAESLVLPGIDGELTILKNHIPLLTSLKSGKVRYKIEKKEFSLDIKRGILEVRPERVVVLVKI